MRDGFKNSSCVPAAGMYQRRCNFPVCFTLFLHDEGPLLNCWERSSLCRPIETADANLSKHPEVTQGGLNHCFRFWRDLQRLRALRQRPALASLGNDAMLALDLRDIPGRNLQAALLQYPRPDFPVGGGVVRRNVGRRLVVQEDVLPAIQKFPTYGEWRRRPRGGWRRHLLYQFGGRDRGGGPGARHYRDRA